jgi:hypothetical protein
MAVLHSMEVVAGAYGLTASPKTLCHVGMHKEEATVKF